jgi:hypothetical protein
MELEYFKESLVNQSPKTREVYTKKYNYIRKALGRDLRTLTVQEVLDFVQNYTTEKGKEATNNTKAGILNIIIMVKKLYIDTETETQFDIDYSLLSAFRETLKTDIKHDMSVRNNKTEVHSIEMLQNYTEGLYISGLYKDYVINYLLINYYVRNEDLNLVITDSEDHDFTTGNWLVLEDPYEVVYIRNNYKTVRTYGQKRNVIVDPKFISAIRKLIANGTKTLTNKQHSYEIKKSTLNQVGESNYLKSIIHVAMQNNDVKLLHRIEEYRGTDIDTLIQNYNIKVNLFKSTLKENIYE